MMAWTVATDVGTASATSSIPQHLCIFTLMASHAIINLCLWQACSYPLFRFTTTWHYSLTLHWFLYHHFFMIPWLHDSIFSPFLYILSCSFLVPQTLYHIQVRHLRWATLYTWYFVLYHINYVPVAIIFTGEYTRCCTTSECDIWAIIFTDSAVLVLHLDHRLLSPDSLCCTTAFKFSHTTQNVHNCIHNQPTCERPEAWSYWLKLGHLPNPIHLCCSIERCIWPSRWIRCSPSLLLAP